MASFLYGRLFFVLAFVPLAPDYLGLAWVIFYVRDHEVSALLLWVLRALFFAMLCGQFWLTRQIAYHFCVDNRLFLDAIRDGWLDARLRLSCLPLFGHWFVYRSDVEGDQDEA